MSMRSRIPLLVLLFVVGSFALPLLAHAQGIPFFGPIIPKEGLFASCPAGWGMLITVINRIIALLLTIAIVFVAPLMIAYSGFLFVVNPVDSGGIAKAKGILLHTIVGIVIALAGWMIVDAIMAVLYKSPNGAWGTWSSLITSRGVADDCLQQQGASIQTGHAPPPPTAISVVTPSANCPVPDQSTMATIPAEYVVGGTGLAKPTTIQNYIAMRTAALQAGFDLKVSSAYRSDATQVALWNQYCSSGTCGATLVAKPCSLGGPGSNHNSGQALDLTDGCTNGQICNTPAYQWLKANGGNWGFYNSIPTDGIHWSPTGR